VECEKERDAGKGVVGPVEALRYQIRKDKISLTIK